MPSVYKEVRSLEHHALVGSGDCVELIKAFAPGLIGKPTSAWRPGATVIEVASTLQPGTAIATFEQGHFPHRSTGQHAAFFVASAGAGIYVIDQWKGDPKNKPYVSMRHIERKGKKKDGSFVDPSNNAEAFSVIER
jgi:hypothetical protein